MCKKKKTVKSNGDEHETAVEIITRKKKEKNLQYMDMIYTLLLLLSRSAVYGGKKSTRDFCLAIWRKHNGNNKTRSGNNSKAESRKKDLSAQGLPSDIKCNARPVGYSYYTQLCVHIIPAYNIIYLYSNRKQKAYAGDHHVTSICTHLFLFLETM